MSWGPYSKDGGAVAQVVERATHNRVVAGSSPAGTTMAAFSGQRVLVGISGGPDSTALLVALHESGHDIVAAHYDHALREGSDAVARQVAAMCDARDIRLVSERRNGSLPKGSMQAAARTLRYQFFERARVEANADVVATAHTADDLVEGVVLHLMRGCGLAGFRGMPLQRGHYVRPLLGVWRSEVLDFLRQRGIVAYEDPANSEPRFARVRARVHIIPQLERDRPGIKRRFHAAAMAASDQQEKVTAQASRAVDEGAGLTELAYPVALEALKLMYTRAGGPQPGLSRAHLDSMLRLTRPGPGGRGVDLPGGLRFRIVGGHMQITSSQPSEQPAPRLEVRTCSGCDDERAAHLRTGLDLRLGHRQPGLRFRPAGGSGRRKLQDVFVDAHIPREERDGWPLVFAGSRLAWVPGVAVEAELMSRPGEPSLHVAVTPMPVLSGKKVVRLETPNSPPGEQI